MRATEQLWQMLDERGVEWVDTGDDNFDTGEPMNEGARIVEAAIAANREMIEGRVRELLDDVPAKSLRNEIADTVERFMDEWLRGDA